MDDDKSKNTFSLLIKSREGLIYKGDVYSLTSVNEQGRFDILPYHANFISLISSILVIGEPGGKKKELKIENGLLRKRRHNVEVYIGVEGIYPQELPTSLKKSAA